MGNNNITDKQLRALDRWHRFVEVQCGCYPATMAAIKLRMTTQGVFQAAERGWIAYFQIGRDRWYGRKDVSRYEEKRSGVKNWGHYRSSEPRDWTNATEEKMRLDTWDPSANVPHKFEEKD